MMSQTDAQPGLLITVTVLAVSSMTIMANATISPSLPGLARAFSNTPNIETLSGLVLSLPSLAIILSAGFFGILADRFDRRILLAAVLVVYALGGASGTLAKTMPQLLVGRFILGLGVGGVMTLATIYAADLWTGPARAKFMGRQGAAISLGGVVFLLLGGFLAELNWRGPFLIYLIALPLAALVLAALPRSEAARSGSPSTPVQTMKRSTVAKICMLAFFAMIAFYIIPTRLPFLMDEIGISSPTIVGLAIAALTAASIPTALNFGRISQALSPPVIFGGALIFMAAGLSLIAAANGLVMVIAGTVTAGIGLGAIMPNQNSWLMAEVPEAARGRAAGLLTTAVFAGQFISPLVAGFAGQFLSPHFVFALFSAAVAMAGLSLVLIGFFLTGPKRNLKPEPKPSRYTTRSNAGDRYSIPPNGGSTLSLK